MAILVLINLTKYPGPPPPNSPPKSPMRTLQPDHIEAQQPLWRGGYLMPTGHCPFPGHRYEPVPSNTRRDLVR